MSVIQGIQNIVRSTSAARLGGSATGQDAFTSISPEAHSDLLRARTELLKLYRAIEKLAELSNINTRFRLDLPDARSTAPLGLDLSQTAASLNSSNQVNASPTSFTPFGPDWLDGSSALLTIGGEYDGLTPSGTLTFEARRGGIRGLRDLQIRVEDTFGGPTRNLTIRSGDPLEQQYDLGSGLYFTLGAGALLNRDTASIQVFDNVGSVVNPDLPLGGIRNQNPNLQFGYPDIVDGGFDLNGESIGVLTSDTLNDIVNRINQSDAGVTAAFNPATERIELLQETPGSAATINLENDSSNFLEATKLDNLNLVAGTDPEDEQPLDTVAVFSSIQSGNAVINGQQIAIDTSSDSLATVLEKINSAGAGVVASFDSASRQVLIEANGPTSVIEIDSNGTGLFAALNIPEGRVDPEAVSRGISRRRSYEIADATSAVFDKLNQLFNDSSFVGKGANASPFRSPLEAALRAVFGTSDENEILGLRFDASSNARLRGDFTSIDRREFTNNLQRRGNLVRDLLAGKNDEGGLVKSLLVASRQALTSVNHSLGLSGTLVDTYA